MLYCMLYYIVCYVCKYCSCFDTGPQGRLDLSYFYRFHFCSFLLVHFVLEARGY